MPEDDAHVDHLWQHGDDLTPEQARQFLRIFATRLLEYARRRELIADMLSAAVARARGEEMR